MQLLEYCKGSNQRQEFDQLLGFIINVLCRFSSVCSPARLSAAGSGGNTSMQEAEPHCTCMLCWNSKSSSTRISKSHTASLSYPQSLFTARGALAADNAEADIDGERQLGWYAA